MNKNWALYFILASLLLCLTPTSKANDECHRRITEAETNSMIDFDYDQSKHFFEDEDQPEHCLYGKEPVFGGETDPNKAFGDPRGCTDSTTGNPRVPQSTQHPIQVATGNKYLHEVDYPGTGLIRLEREYNSLEGIWRYNWDYSLYDSNNPATPYHRYQKSAPSRISCRAPHSCRSFYQIIG